MSFEPRDPFAAAVDRNGRWTPEWYSWLRELAALVSPTPVAVAQLPSAVSAGAGARAFVTDANATTFGTVVAAGGSNKVPVYSNGTNWIIG